MEIRLLGPVELYSARGPVPIGSAKQRALLAFLALHPQRLLTYDVLLDGLWGDEQPDATVQALRFHVSRLRVILRQVDDADRLRTRPGGYQLVVDDDAVDVLRFERAVAGARLARSEGAAPDTVSRALRDALDLWVGPALADVNGEPFVVGERRRLEELRLAATQDYFAAELAGDRHAEAVAELEQMVDREPLREPFWALLITALYRSGRQADALAAYQRLRRILADELGLEPSAPLRELERRVLVQDTGLAKSSTPPGPASDTYVEPPTPADAEPPHAEADVRVPRRLATRALALAVALGILGLGLFWLGVVSNLFEASDDESGNRTEVSDSTATADRTEVTDDTEAADRTEVTNDYSVHDALTPIDSLQVGDCSNLLSDPQPRPQGASVSQLFATGWTVSLVPCEEPHDQETYHLFELATGPYPGDEQVQAQAIDQCSVQFQNYVGVAADESALDFFYVYPDRSWWQQGIRLGGCSLHEATGLDLTGSMAGSGR
jgi:DNA-binding SARP family transcriptional activator